VLQRLLGELRSPADWRPAFVASIHSRVFGKLFPGQAAVFRAGETIFGKQSGVPVHEIETRFSNLVAQMACDLRTISQIGDGDELTQATFLAAAQSHAEMIRIHPFIDGNGRWARIATGVFLCDCGFHAGTIVRAARKREYISAMDRAIESSECGDLANILLDGYIEQAEKHPSSGRKSRRYQKSNRR
jgi:fido (protein-threonine AMPylation protein)